MGKAIITYLVNDDPRGVREITQFNRGCYLTVIPREQLDYINSKSELKHPALYILLGEDSVKKSAAYIGQTKGFFDRIKIHKKEKTFWNKVLVFASQTQEFTSTDVQHLEYLAIKLAQEADNYTIEGNKQIPKETNLKQYQRSNIEELFNDIKLLTLFSGCNIFEIRKKQMKHLFYTKGRGCDASGYWENGIFTVLKGAIVRQDVVRSFTWKDKRGTMIKNYTIMQNDRMTLKEDIEFKSPSTAADFCIGSSNNGWIVWKDEEGKTLDEVFRK